ncbi:MAG: hypothetical protein KGD58_14445 [Candidatus Lokiarchaeota archaeon]|nr:hypothetical protein [Candidatus Lokiarchaeota archaeon]
MSKIQEFLDKNFHHIFNNSHFLYTIVFILSTLLIALLSFIPGSNVGNLILFLASTFSLTFLFLMFEGLIPQLKPYLFSSEKKFDRRKVISFLLNFFFSFFIILLYFLTSPSNQLTVQFIGWDFTLPVIFITVYFGWNLVQIFYLRIGFEDISVKVNEKITLKFGVSKKKRLIDIILLVFALIISFMIQLGTFLAFLPEFLPHPGDDTEPLIWYAVSNIIILVLFIITSWRLITLFHRSRKIGESNSYSSMFYFLVWLIIWFRSFSFFSSFQGIVQSTAELEILSRFMDILLMLLTALLVLRSLGDKVYDSMIFNTSNMPFFLFSFTLLYIEGQIILITGAGSLTGVFADRNQINLINSFLIIIITVCFYWWYSEHALERKGFIVKKHFYPEDVVVLINDFKHFLESRDALDKTRIGDDEVVYFLDSKNIKIQPVEPTTEENKVVPENNDEERIDS